MTAHVGDFGLARFIEEAINPSHRNESSSVGLKGTVGYAAPGMVALLYPTKLTMVL
jgi:hypothetical protein